MKNHLACAALALFTAAPLLATAQPIELVPNTVNMFRDTRGANDVGLLQGDSFQFGADIVGGSLGVSLGAVYPASGLQVPQFGCAPLAVNQNFCARTIPFNLNRLDPWNLIFTRGSDTLTVAGPSIRGAEAQVPFPRSVTLSGGGLRPTITFELPDPAVFVPDGFRVNIFDKGVILPTGHADVIHTEPIAPNATSFTLPIDLSSGQRLREGGNYTINFQLIETRDNLPFTGNNAQILRRSSSFFAFTPLDNSAPPNVKLPTVVDGVYNFDFAIENPDSITFIDPFVAVGYDYATGDGDPNFASVLLPDVGDGVFTLTFGNQTATVEDGAQFFFPQGGVDAFRVSGIETSAMLDPANVTAFITGLTFVADGSFTGTMTPLTVFVVPEPETYALLFAGLALLALVRRRAVPAHR